MSRREEVSLSERLLRGCGRRLCMGKMFSGENMHVLEKGTYVALRGFAVAMLARIARCREADIGSGRDRKIESPQTISQIALCYASAPFLEEARLH